MPIYGYQCSACGHQKDVLQKLSDPVLTTCPQCQEESFARQLSAPAFQLKGSGWYVTDFKDDKKKPADGASKSDSSDKSSSSDSAQSASDTKSSSDTKASSGDGATKSTSKAESSPAKSASASPAPASGSSSSS